MMNANISVLAGQILTVVTYLRTTELGRKGASIASKLYGYRRRASSSIAVAQRDEARRRENLDFLSEEGAVGNSTSASES